jgi:hypothetical protein
MRARIVIGVALIIGGALVLVYEGFANATHAASTTEIDDRALGPALWIGIVLVLCGGGVALTTSRSLTD